MALHPHRPASAPRCPPSIGAVAPLVAVRIAAVDARGQARAYEARPLNLGAQQECPGNLFGRGARHVSGVVRLPALFGSAALRSTCIVLAGGGAGDDRTARPGRGGP